MLVASDNLLQVFNLCSAAVQATLTFEVPITCVSYYPTCAFVYIGLKNGEVSVVNVDTWSKSLYRIQTKDLQLPSTISDFSVVSIAINPERDDIILLGFACGAINEWEIKTAKVLRRYLSDKALTFVTWDPSGNKFIAGHANGELVVWTRKKSIADEVYHPIINPQRPNAIKRVYWVAPKPSSSDQTIVALGGTDFYNGLVVENLKQKKRTYVPLAPKGVELRDARLVFAPVGSAGSLSSSASSSSSTPASPANSATAPSMEPVAVIAVDARGSIYVHALNGEIDERGLLPSVNPPLPFSLDSVHVLASLVVSEPNGLLQDLVATGNIDPTDALKGQTSSLMWPLTGGIFTIDPNTTPVILITLMSNNSVIFWDLSMRNCRVPIYRIRLPGVVNAKTNLVFDFCSSSRILHVGNGSDVFVYHFCPETRNVELMTIDETAPAQPTATASPIQSQSPSSPLKKSDHQSSSPSSQAKPDSSSSKEISSESPASPATSDKIEEPMPTPPETLDEAAPTPPTMTPSSPQQQAKNASTKLESSADSSSAAASPGAVPATGLPTSSSQSSLNASVGSHGSPPLTGSVVTRAPPPRVTMTPLPSQPAGFQFVASMTMSGKPIQTLKFESGLGMLAVSTGDGVVRVFKTFEQYAPLYTYNPPANTLPCPPIVTQLEFCEASLGTAEKPEDHLLLCMGLDIGSVQTVSLTNPSKSLKSISARKSPVIDIHVVAHRGNYLPLSKARWNRDPHAPAPRYTPSHGVPKFLVVCTVNDVRAYKIPEFEMVSQYECPAPIAWYGTIEVSVDVQGKMEQEYVLAAIDMASNVLYIRLMNLTLVSYVGPNNLTKLGAEGISPMSTPKSCNLMDGSVFLFTETSELYVVKVLPFEERRPVTKLLGPEPPKPIAKRSKGLKGLIGKDKDVDFEAVFGTRKEVSPPAASSTASSSSSTGNNAPRAPPKPSAVQGQTNEVKGVMRENIDRLEERGERLRDLADRTEEMSNAAQGFSALAKQLSKQQKSSWF